MIRIYTCPECHRESEHWGIHQHQTWYGEVGVAGEYVEIGSYYVICPFCGTEIEEK